MAHNNCFMVVDGRNGEVVASVEYSREEDEQGICALYLYAIDKTFKRKRVKTVSRSYDRSPTETAYLYLTTHWSEWVPIPWKRWHVVTTGGGSFWPRKLKAPGKWTKKPYSHEMGKFGSRE